MAELLFTIASSDVPGALGENRLRISNHIGPHGQLTVWRGRSSFQDAPTLLLVHGGLYHNPGDRAMEGPTQGTALFQLILDLSAKGWVIMSYDHPPSPSRADVNRDTWPALFPQVQLYVAHCIAMIRANGNAVDPLRKTDLAVKMLGDGNSLNGIVGVWGGSSGMTAASAAAFLPNGYFHRHSYGGSLAFDPGQAYGMHRPNFVLGDAGQLDWTQFHVTSADVAASPYQRDQMQYLNRGLSPRRWSTTDVRAKAAASPWHQLVEKLTDGTRRVRYPENMSMPCHWIWGGNPDTEGANLTEDHFLEGRILDGSLGTGLEWSGPHHPFQGRFLERSGAVGTLMDPRSVILWSDDPYNPTASTRAPATDQDYSDGRIDWIENTLGIASPL